MGLSDRDWFWEGYEERYGFKKKEHRPEQKKQQNNTQVQKPSKTITHYCKRCNKLINVSMPEVELGPFFQYAFVCPYCGKKNNLGNDKAWKWILTATVVVVLILFLMIYFGN